MMNLKSEDDEIESSKSLEDVINTSPGLICDTVSLMETTGEKTMSLYAMTVIAGAIMPHIHFNYDGVISYPNLYALVVFPPGSGKGRLTQVRHVLDKIHEEQMENNGKAMGAYKSRLKTFEKTKGGKLPERPKLPMLLAPGNTTSSKLVEQLDDNDGKCMTLIFETEVDALTTMMNSKFGGENSTILRKAFHNEPISLSRKTNSEYLSVNMPKVAVVLSGTHSQLPRLFQGVQDGTFSRFMILSGGAPTMWKDVSPDASGKSLTAEIGKLADRAYKVYTALKDMKIEVSFTMDQWRRLNQFGETHLEEIHEDIGENAKSIPMRHGLMIAKAACIYTVLRSIERQSEDAKLVCQDIDFDNAMWIMERSYESALEVFQTLSHEETENIGMKNEFLEKLPDSFKVRELEPLRDMLSISKKTVERYLSKLVQKGKLEKLNKGSYRKTRVSDVTDVASETPVNG